MLLEAQPIAALILERWNEQLILRSGVDLLQVADLQTFHPSGVSAAIGRAIYKHSTPPELLPGGGLVFASSSC